MSVLLLTLSGPLQSWGERSRFVRREAGTEPTKSGIVGLLAAALGRRRTDPIEDLASLTFGVRIDQPGSLLRDFQTARSLDGSRTMPLSTRYYLSDAVFLAAVEGDSGLIDGVADALRNPTFPLYLGRRSCPPAAPVARADSVRSGSLVGVLSEEPWRAAPWYQRRVDAPYQRLTLSVDELAVDSDDTRWAAPVPVRDLPLSFDPRDRQYGLRTVVRSTVEVANPTYRPRTSRFGEHDAFAELEG